MGNLEGSYLDAVAKGAYVLRQAADVLLQAGVEATVVSMPCWELFDAQPLEYRRTVLASGLPVLAVEAASDMGWSKYAHATQCMTTFGASGPMKDVAKKFGFTVDSVVEKANKLLAHYAAPGRTVPDLQDLPC